MSKKVYCPLFGFIEFTSLEWKILNTPEMQRLREIKQLGATYFVFPSAHHSRLEHSMGVCYLAGRMGKSLQKKHPEFNITDRYIELWGIAGLIHDIGHGPFSHLYDKYVKFSNEPDHEERGLQIFDEIYKREKLPMSDFEVREIHNMVNPTGKNIYNWRYQIVANKSCQIDVDKIDYIQRDAMHTAVKYAGEYSRLISEVRICTTPRDTEELAWNEKLQFEIYSLFATRYRLHKQIYTHHVVKAFEYLIIEVLKNIRLQKTNLDFINLTDATVISECYQSNNIYGQRLIRRQHPKLVGEIVITKDIDREEIHGMRIILEYIIEEIKIGFVSGDNENPLKNVYYFNKTNPLQAHQIDHSKTSFIIPDKFQERILRLYTFNGVDAAKKYWNQLIKQYV